jgi:hypothetical protein
LRIITAPQCLFRQPTVMHTPPPLRLPRTAYALSYCCADASANVALPRIRGLLCRRRRAAVAGGGVRRRWRWRRGGGGRGGGAGGAQVRGARRKTGLVCSWRHFTHADCAFSAQQLLSPPVTACNALVCGMCCLQCHGVQRFETCCLQRFMPWWRRHRIATLAHLSIDLYCAALYIQLVVVVSC